MFALSVRHRSAAGTSPPSAPSVLLASTCLAPCSTPTSGASTPAKGFRAPRWTRRRCQATIAVRPAQPPALRSMISLLARPTNVVCQPLWSLLLPGIGEELGELVRVDLIKLDVNRTEPLTPPELSACLWFALHGCLDARLIDHEVHVVRVPQGREDRAADTKRRPPVVILLHRLREGERERSSLLERGQRPEGMCGRCRGLFGVVGVIGAERPQVALQVPSAVLA